MRKGENGIEKEVDALGRVVLPKNFRTRLGLDTNSKVVISMDGDSLHIIPNQSRCAICKKHAEINPELKICSSCIERVRRYQ